MIPFIGRRDQLPFDKIMETMLTFGNLVDTGHWQGLKDVPNTRTVELRNVVVEAKIQPTAGSWAASCQPNLPWAEDHFQERVSGEPTNPGEEYKNWPWYKENWEAQDTEKKFSHTYQERIWPKFAPDGMERIGGINSATMPGIRYPYGDLNDVLELLSREPYTRQAYLPIWFPEDTGAHHGERVPCTLGYHFMLREERLHCFYPMRSVDLVRYFRDDVYMAGRLVQWILQELTPPWDEIQPGILTFFASSLHVFEDELPALRRKYGQVPSDS